MAQCLIRPSIFIGLGSTGTEVLDYIREYFYEEFGVAGLPIFYYLSISTDKQDTQAQVYGIKEEDYEKIHVEKTFIHNMDDVISRLDPKQTTLYSQYKGMEEWFDRNILKKSLNAVNVGAGGVRQIGRLALWMNLEKVFKRIQQFKNVIKDKNARETIREGILKQYNLRKKNDVLVDVDFSGEVDVYIISSLVGGSGSGMFMDVALLTKAELENQIGKNKVHIYGFFTAMDQTTVGLTRGYNTPAANTMASLYELNYFHNRKGGGYIQYPFQANPIEFEDPFNDIFLMTPSMLDEQTYQSSNAFDGENEQPLMRRILGLTIFLNTSGSAILERSQKVNVDLVVSADGYDKPKPEPDPGFIRFLHVFGLYVIWFPKNRIADCASYLITKQFIELWTGEEEKTLEKKSKIIEDVENTFDAFFQKSYNVFIQDEQMNLDSQIQNDLSDAVNQILEEKKLDELEIKLSNIPKQNPLSRSFKVGSKYQRTLESRVITFKNLFMNLIDGKIQNLLSGYSEKDSYTIQDIKLWIDLLSEYIESRLADLPDSIYELDVSDLKMEKYFHFGLLKTLTLQKNKTIQKGKKELIKDFTSLVEEAWQTMKAVYIKSALVQILKNTKNIRDSLLTSLEGKLSSIKLKAEDSFSKLSEFSVSPKRIRIVTVHGGKIEDDARMIASKVVDLFDQNDNNQQSIGLFRDVFYSSDLLDISKRSILQQMLEDDISENDVKTNFVSKICNHIKDKILHDYYNPVFGGFSLVDKYSKLSLSELVDDYTQSQVLASTSHTYNPLPLNKRPNFSGGGGNKLNEIIEKLETQLPWMQSYKTTGMHLDNIIFYYREIPGIALSDLKLYDSFKPIYDNNPSCEVSNHHIHKNPSKFDPNKFKKIDSSKETVFPLVVLLKEYLFEIRDSKLIYRYQDLSDRPRVAFMDDGGFRIEKIKDEMELEKCKNIFYSEAENFYSFLIKDNQYFTFEMKIKSICMEKKVELTQRAAQIVDNFYNHQVLSLEKSEELRESLYSFIDRYTDTK